MLGKKCISLIIAGAVMVSSATMVCAQSEITVQAVQRAGTTYNEGNPIITKDKALEIVKKTIKDYFNVTVDEKKFQTNIEYRKDYENNSQNVWQINYNFNDSTINRYYAVTINSDSGNVIAIYMNEYDSGNTMPAIATITYDQAKEIAEDFLKKINPEQAKQVECIENYPTYYSSSYKMPAVYNFRFVSKVNGIRFDTNSIDITIEGSTGKINAYSYRWIEDIEFPSLDGVITEDKAMQVLMDEANFNLKYLIERTQNDYTQMSKKAKLVYYPEFGDGSLVDAKSGKLANWNTENVEEIKTIDLSVQEKDAIIKDLKPLTKADEEIDSKRATDIIKEKIKELIGEGYDIDQLSYYENDYGWASNENKVWNAQFYKKGDVAYSYDIRGNISINAYTGEIVNLYSYNRYDMEKPINEAEIKISWEEAYKKSIDIISKTYPTKFKDVKTLQRYLKNTYTVNGKEMGEKTYNFSYPRIVNEIDYPENSIYITISAIDGTVVSINCNWFDNIEFTPKDGILKLEDAKKIFLKEHEPKLTYILPYINDNDEDAKQEVKLVYTLNAKKVKDYSRVAMIDAYTGKLIDYDGSELKEITNIVLDKLNGHWAEKQLSILAYQKIINLSSFDVDKEISLMDAIKIIVSAKGYEPYIVKDADQLKFTNLEKDDPDVNYIQMAVKYGVIDDIEVEFDKSKPVTREKMAEFMVKLLQYEKLALANDIFNLAFKDVNEIDQSLYGSIAICKGLGILQGSDNLFRPKDETTMAEFGVAVYKTLECLKN